MRLAAIHNPTRKGRGESVTFPLEYQLTVQQSMRRKKPIIVAETENVQLKVLFALLGSSDVGPLLVQPLVMEGEAIGAIIAGNSRSRRPFTPNEAKLCQSMADQLVGAIENANRYNEAREELANLEMMRKQERTVFREATERVQELTEKLANAETEVKELQQREEAAREARNALEIQLMSSRAEMDTLSERLVVLEGDLAQAHASAKAQMRWYEEELTRQEGAWQDTAQIAEWIQTVLQSMMAGLLVVDAEGVIQRANVASGILLGQDIEELQGLPVKAVSDDERWQQAVAAASNGEAVRVTMQVASSTLMCDLAPSADSEDDRRDANPVTVILQDVSAEAEEKRARLEKISAMAENLRTPVTTVISYADLLLSETVGIIGDVQRKFLLRMKAGAERIIQMIDDLSQEAGGEERWTLLQRESVDVTKLVEAAVASSHVQLEDKSLTVELDLSSDLPTIQADPDYLRRVLSNLLSNACLASSVGGRVEVKASQSDNLPFEQEQLEYNGDGFVIVSVKDSGGGLSEDAFHRIFDQGRPSQTPLGLGESGAGLALTKTLVEAHGGRLWVENHSGIGATFSVVLPVDDREVEPHRKNLGEPST
jgi:signal transduction histidine kinase